MFTYSAYLESEMFNELHKCTPVLVSAVQKGANSSGVGTNERGERNSALFG
jgi:hypothetical protein